MLVFDLLDFELILTIEIIFTLECVQLLTYFSTSTGKFLQCSAHTYTHTHNDVTEYILLIYLEAVLTNNNNNEKVT